jgi:hypothetical protein
VRESSAADEEEEDFRGHCPPHFCERKTKNGDQKSHTFTTVLFIAGFAAAALR